DAIPRVRQRIESLERDLVSTGMALPEGLRRAVQPAERLIDMPEEASLLAREEERLLAFHGVGALVSHVEGVAAEVPIRCLHGRAERLIRAPELLQHPPTLLQQTLL